MTDDPPLLSAARHDCYELLCQFLERVRIRNQTNKFGETALILAAQRGFEKGVERLLQAGADPLQMGGDYYLSCAIMQLALPISKVTSILLKNCLSLLSSILLKKLGGPAVVPVTMGIRLLDDALLKLENVYGQPTFSRSSFLL